MSDKQNLHLFKTFQPIVNEDPQPSKAVLRRGWMKLKELPGQDLFEATFDLRLSEVNLTASIPTERNFLGAGLMDSLQNSLGEGESVTITFNGAGSDRSVERVETGITLRTSAPMREVAAERLKAMRQRCANAFGAFSASLNFAPSKESGTQTQLRHRRSYRAEGIKLSCGDSTRAIGFGCDIPKAPARNTMLFTVPSGGDHEALAVLLEALARSPQKLRCAVTLTHRKLNEAEMASLSECIEAYENGSARLFNPSDESVEIDEKGEAGPIVKSLLKTWGKNGEGIAVAVQMEGENTLPEGFESLISRAFALGSLDQAITDDALENGQEPLDLRGCLPKGVGPALLLPSTEVFRHLGVKQRLPLPHGNLPAEGVRLGSVQDGPIEIPIQLPEHDRNRHVYIIGGTGTGKSTTLTAMIKADIESGKGLILIDPHGDLFNSALTLVPRNRHRDVVAIDVSMTDRPVGINLLEADHDNPAQVNFVVNEMIKVFLRLYHSETCGPMFEMYMRSAMLLLLHSPHNPTLVSVTRIFEDEDFRHKVEQECYDPFVLSTWKGSIHRAGGDLSFHNVGPWIVSKLNQFCLNPLVRPMIGQPRSHFSMKEAIESRKIVLVNLPKGLIGEHDAKLLGMMLMGQLFCAAMGRVKIPESERHPFAVYVDEFQNFATSTAASMFAEARKFGLQLVVANQSLSQLSGGPTEVSIRDALLGNVGTLLISRVGPADAALLSTFTGKQLGAEELQKLPDFHAAVRMQAYGKPVEPFVMSTPRPSNAINTPGECEALKNYSNQRYGRPRTEVEEAIMRACGITPICQGKKKVA